MSFDLLCNLILRNEASQATTPQDGVTTEMARTAKRVAFGNLPVVFFTGKPDLVPCDLDVRRAKQKAPHFEVHEPDFEALNRALAILHEARLHELMTSEPSLVDEFADMDPDERNGEEA